MLNFVISLQIISIAFQRKFDVQRNDGRAIKSRFPGEIPKYFTHNGLCWVREVSTMGQITGMHKPASSRAFGLL